MHKRYAYDQGPSCTMYEKTECGVLGAIVCWEAGAYVVVGRNAASSANKMSTDEEGLRSTQ